MNTQYDTIERGNRDKSRVVNLYCVNICSVIVN